MDCEKKGEPGPLPSAGGPEHPGQFLDQGPPPAVPSRSDAVMVAVEFISRIDSTKNHPGRGATVERLADQDNPRPPLLGISGEPPQAGSTRCESRLHPAAFDLSHIP